MKDDQSSNDRAALQTIVRSLKPEEVFARGMSAGAHGAAKPPSLEEMARLFPEFEMIALLGYGGMGAVYKARQLSLDRIVAIKLLPRDGNRGREFAERFKREAQMMARLHHPNLVTLYNFGQTTGGHLFFVMEYVEGATLQDLVRSRALTPAQVLRIFSEICEGLASAHREGVVHRDIKPANILVDLNGRAKIADFGLAKSTTRNSDAMLTIRGMAVGTPDYMAPEQRRGEHVDHHADIYALGIALYEALTRELPRGICPPPSQLVGTPPMLDEIVGRAMQQDPAKRFQSTMEMKAALDSVSFNGSPAQRGAKLAATTKPSAPRPQPGAAAAKVSQSNRAVMGVAIAASLVVVALLGYALSRPAKSVRPVAPHYVPTPVPIAAATPVSKMTSAIAATRPSTTPTTTSAAKPPTKQLTFGDSRYQLIRSQASWMQAKTEAEFKGGHLATITTKEENEWVRKTFGPELDRKWTRIWIGAYQTDREDTWHWVTDEEFKFTDWIPGEPNGAKNMTQTPPFCACIANSKGEPGATGWDDTTPGGSASVVGYLVEWDEPKAAPPAAPVAAATPTPAPVAKASTAAPATMAAMATPAPAVAAMATPAPAPAAPAAAPATNEAEQRLAAIKAQYEVAYARDIARTFDAARDVLRNNYQAAIDREIARVAQTGRVADTVVLREERVRAGIGKGLDSDPSTLPEALKPLRIAYRTNLAKLEGERALKLKPIRDGYLKLLDAAQADFAKVQKADAALAVKQRRDALAAEWASEAAQLPLPVVAEAKAPTSLTGATVDPTASSWRKAALFTLRNGGKLDIRVDNKRTPAMLEIDLPTRRYDLLKVELTDPDKNAKLTDADFAVLATCRDLEELRIERAPITSKALEFLHGLTTLKTLRINGCPRVTDSIMPAIGTLTNLTSLELQNDGITKEGVKSLARCNKLRRLSLHGGSYSAACVATLAQLPIEELSLIDVSEPSALSLSGFRQLRTVTINGAKDAKAHVIDELSRLKSIETLRLANDGIGDDDLAKFSGLTGLRVLELDGNSVTGSGLANLKSCRSLDRLRLNNCGASDAALEIIGRDLTGLRFVTISGPSKVQGASFRALGKCRALKEVNVYDGVGDDTVAAELSLIPTVDFMNFAGCPQLSDAGLQSLTRAKALKRLNLARCTKLTDAGVAAFKKSRPDVTVER